ncbi:MAG TPA: alpha/beta fold hydrolase [Thermoleophilaceae bacterium]|nr:alpha/beta fold hydrolase [Thermoleophilaceae bacterium]
MLLPDTGAVVRAHRAAGRRFAAGGIHSFVRETGAGEPVVCLHGVPASCFLYRKVLDELAARGLCGVAFDLPGLGLADRPPDFDYTWTGLGRFCREAVDALGLERFHLVVHDIGGPVGFELAAAMPQRVMSLTLPNTIVAVDGFERPSVMEPFAVRGVRRLWLRSLTGPSFLPLMYLVGVGDRRASPPAELMAYVDLLKRHDGGEAFLKIMRGFERTHAKRDLYVSAVRDVPYPVQVLWGRDDPALTLEGAGEAVRRAVGLERLDTVPGRHFLQEEHAPAIADRVADVAAGA